MILIDENALFAKAKKNKKITHLSKIRTSSHRIVAYHERMSHDLTSFETQVIERSREVPVVVDFWASWCGPCLMFSPILEKAVADAGGAWDLVKVNTEEHPDLSARYQIRSLPTLKLFLNGEEVAESLGALTESQLLRWIARFRPSPFAVEIEEAERALLAGESAIALEKIAPILEAEPGNDHALYLKVRATFASDPAGVPALVKDFPHDSDYASRAHGLRDLAALLSHVPGLDGGELSDTLANGYTALRRLDFAPACEAFLSVLEKDRHFASDAAAKALKQIFLHLGPRHEITDQYQRRFASLLFS